MEEILAEMGKHILDTESRSFGPVLLFHRKQNRLHTDIKEFLLYKKLLRYSTEQMNEIRWPL